MLDRFTPAARQTIVRAGELAVETGHGVIGTELLLLAVADVHAFASFTADEVRAVLEPDFPRRGDQELLATLGIDLAEVRRRASAVAGGQEAWRLSRSAFNPLRLRLDGPPGRVRLDGRARKVIEVALWARCHRSKVDAHDLLWGLLADGRNESVRVLRRIGVDFRQLWRGLHRWHAPACAHVRQH